MVNLKTCFLSVIILAFSVSFTTLPASLTLALTVTTDKPAYTVEEEINIYGSFQGDDWVHILKKVINAYDKQLRLGMDEKNRKITITFKLGK